MLCGKYRRELVVQQSVNDTFVRVMDKIIRVRYGAPETKEYPWEIDLAELKVIKAAKKKQKKDKSEDEEAEVVPPHLVNANHPDYAEKQKDEASAKD